MDKMREEFEAWHLSQVADDGVVHIDLWSAWKASRNALNAELDAIDARIKHECKKADYLKVVCAKIIDDINRIQIERF